MLRSARLLFLASCSSLLFATGCFQDFELQPNPPYPSSTGTGGDGVSDTRSSGGSRGSGGTAGDDGGEATTGDGGSQSESGNASDGGDADAGDQTGTSSDGSGTDTGSASAGDDTAADSGTDACPSGEERVFDGSFEAAALSPDNTSPFWEETVPGDYSIICDSSCDGSGVNGASDGEWWAWFGGSPTPGVWILEQALTLPAGANRLDFNLRIPQPESDLLTGTFDVQIDGQLVYTITADTFGYENWTPVQVDIAAFADGQSHTLTFVAEFVVHIDQVQQYANEFLLDEVSITCE